MLVVKKCIRLLFQIPFIISALILSCSLFIILYPVAWLVFCWKWICRMGNKKSVVKTMNELFFFIFMGTLQIIKGQFND